MSKRDERLKASDIFEQTNFVFAKEVPFEQAFPEIEDITVEVKETGRGVYGEGRGVYVKGNIGEYIDCSNSFCYKGGFSIGSIIREMVKERKTELETTEFCQGYEGSQKGRRKYRDCINSFEIKVSIKYKK